MCRRRERASADRRVRSGPACWSVPAEQNGERRRTAPAKQLRQWRSVWNFSPENLPVVFECSTLATLSHQKQEGEGPRQSHDVQARSALASRTEILNLNKARQVAKQTSRVNGCTLSKHTPCRSDRPSPSMARETSPTAPRPA